MIVKMTQCDNPKCDNRAEPDVPRRPPYLWFGIRFHQEGPTGLINVVACSLECCGPAIAGALGD